ncbi:MAG TPA: delta-60 repeat domain-containing protein [Solirubrobacteraceae bacterium]
MEGGLRLAVEGALLLKRSRVERRTLNGSLRLVVAAAVLAGVLATVSAAAVGGSVDSRFGGDGIVTTDLGANDVAQGVAVQPDGKIVVAGSTEQPDGSANFAAVRYSASGALDQAFGSGGTVRFTPAPGFGASDVALQADGKILLAGVVSGGAGRGLDAVVARLNSDGSIDGSFGDGGSKLIDFAGGRDFAEAVAVQPDGKILVAGDAADAVRQDEDFALARLTTSGQLDPSFGGDGHVRTDFPGGSAGAMAVTVEPDGKIVAVGRGGESFNSLCSPRCSYALARYNPDGSLDSSFGGGGLVEQGFDLPAIAEAVAVQRDGKTVVAGSGRVARFTAQGALDPAFGSGGSTDTGPFTAQSVSVDNGGRIILAGTLAEGTASRFAVMRLTAAGAKDPRFGTPTAGAGDDYATGGAIDSSGRIVVAGFVAPGSGPWDFAAARFQPPRCIVPDTRKLTLTAAAASLRAAGCSLGTVTTVRAKGARGRVTAQGAPPRTQLPEDSRVNLKVSNGAKRS